MGYQKELWESAFIKFVFIFAMWVCGTYSPVSQETKIVCEAFVVLTDAVTFTQSRFIIINIAWLKDKRWLRLINMHMCCVPNQSFMKDTKINNNIFFMCSLQNMKSCDRWNAYFC